MKKCKVVLLLLSTVLVLSGCGNNNSYLKKGVKALEHEKYSEAVQYFEEMIEAESKHKPNNDKKKLIWENNLFEAYKGIGISYFETKEYDKALEAFEKCIELEGTKTPVMYRNMAVCAKMTSDYNKATEYAEDALRLISEDKDFDNNEIREELYFIVIQNYEANGDFDSALDWAEEYNELYPGNKDMEKEIMFLQTR